MAELDAIQGIGPELAKKLEEAGIKTRKDLKDSDFYNDLSVMTKADLEYNPVARVERHYIDQVKEMLDDRIGRNFLICGSYRRGRPSSGDIDIVFKTRVDGRSFWVQFLEKIRGNDIVRFHKPFSFGEQKIMTYGFIKELGRHVQFDFFISKPEEWAYQILYTTGSHLFNIRMRALAKKRGMMLNQHGLYRNLGKGERIPAKTERDIFDALKMAWKEPEEREQ